MSERAIDRLDPGMSGKPVYEAPDYSNYEFSWEPGFIRVHWSLTRDDDEGMMPLARGRAFTLDKARKDAFEAMSLDATLEYRMPARIEDGNELMRNVQSRDLAERH